MSHWDDARHPSVALHGMGAFLICAVCFARYELDRLMPTDDDDSDAPCEDDNSLCDRLYDGAGYEGWACGMGEPTRCPACRNRRAA